MSWTRMFWLPFGVWSTIDSLLFVLPHLYNPFPKSSIGAYNLGASMLAIANSYRAYYLHTSGSLCSGVATAVLQSV